MPHHAGPRGKAPRQSRSRRSKGTWAQAFIVVFSGKVRQARVSS